MRVRGLLLAALLGGSAGAAPTARAASPLGAARQLVVVTAPAWESTTGQLRRWERARPGAAWRPVGRPLTVTLGKAGLAWGIGLHGAAPSPPVKREGDNRAPAGAFRLSAVFGYRDTPGKVRMPYTVLTPRIECVDDPSSAHYNTLVDRSKVSPQDWTSSEHMLRPDGLYRIGVVVDHNADHPVASAGSCIFLHIWGGPGAPTAGCTALDAGPLAELLLWLVPSAQPALVQLPANEYARLRRAWALP